MYKGQNAMLKSVACVRVKREVIRSHRCVAERTIRSRTAELQVAGMPSPRQSSYRNNSSKIKKKGTYTAICKSKFLLSFSCVKFNKHLNFKCQYYFMKMVKTHTNT